MAGTGRTGMGLGWWLRSSLLMENLAWAVKDRIWEDLVGALVGSQHSW